MVGLPEYQLFYQDLLKENPGLQIIVNDYWEFAWEVSAFGIHLGKEDFLNLDKGDVEKFSKIPCIKGTSSHSLDDLKSLDLELWDYSGFGPIFPTQTKVSEYKTLGIEVLKQATQISQIKLVPIGGITMEHFPEILVSENVLPASISAFSEKENFKKIISYFG